MGGQSWITARPVAHREAPSAFRARAIHRSEPHIRVGAKDRSAGTHVSVASPRVAIRESIRR